MIFDTLLVVVSAKDKRIFVVVFVFDQNETSRLAFTAYVKQKIIATLK